MSTVSLSVTQVNNLITLMTVVAAMVVMVGVARVLSTVSDMMVMTARLAATVCCAALRAALVMAVVGALWMAVVVYLAN